MGYIPLPSQQYSLTSSSKPHPTPFTIEILNTITNIIIKDITKDGINDIVGVRGYQTFTVKIVNELYNDEDNAKVAHTRTVAVNWEEVEDIRHEWVNGTDNPNGVRGEYPVDETNFSAVLTGPSASGYTIRANSEEKHVYFHLAGRECRSEGCIIIDSELLEALLCTRGTNSEITVKNTIKDCLNYRMIKEQYPGSVYRP